jgi:vacuolar-type H+-ATPase subunit E/Vma4
MPRNEISNTDDVIDSRDVIARIDELTDERDALQDAVDEARETLSSAENDHETESEAADENAMADAAAAGEMASEALAETESALADWEADYGEELAALEALADEGENAASDWRHGATLIRDSYFTEYCQELVSDIGDMPREIPGYIVIDWEATADNLRVDYTEVEFDGETYLIR